MKIKICGITNIDDALLCESLGADALGFIFYPESKRYITPDKAKNIIKQLSPFTMKVGVFVNEPIEFINEIAQRVKLNAVQIHSSETPDELNNISLPVIKAFRVNDEFDYSQLKNYYNVNFLLDTYSKKEYGGTGKAFNWEKIPPEYKSKIILAGGVSIENIEVIYNTVKPAAVDLSSSLESAPGKKDRDKVIRFFDKVNKLNTGINNK